MANIRINALPATTTPAPSTDVVPIDNGTTRKITITNLVNSVAPVASQAEATAGTDNTKRMTSLRVKQAIDDVYLRESGNWTPTILVNGSGTGVTFSARIGTYIKLDRLVTLFFDITLSNKGAGPTGAIQIGGFPFSANSTPTGGVIAFFSNFEATAGDNLTMFASNATTAVNVMKYNGTTGRQSVQYADITNTSRLSGTISYMTT